MPRIFITGSTDGLGLMAAELLLTDDLSLAPVTQAWLAAGDDPRTDVTGEYFYHQEARHTHPAAHDPRRQDALLDYCALLTSTPLPDP